MSNTDASEEVDWNQSSSNKLSMQRFNRLELGSGHAAALFTSLSVELDHHNQLKPEAACGQKKYVGQSWSAYFRASWTVQVKIELLIYW